MKLYTFRVMLCLSVIYMTVFWSIPPSLVSRVPFTILRFIKERDRCSDMLVSVVYFFAPPFVGLLYVFEHPFPQAGRGRRWSRIMLPLYIYSCICIHFSISCICFSVHLLFYVLRLGMEGGGGAWCPRSMVDSRQKEWLEVDLGALRLVTAVATQGRHANGQGQEYTPAYTLSYWRPGMGGFTFYSAHPNKSNIVRGEVD